jgi:LmbE family N-acetylglucosaminyl deacetylase
MSDSPLQKLNMDGVERILCVVAHPDDLEYGISAAVAAWTAAGVQVDYLLMTAGEAGMQRAPAEVGPLRAQEQRVACDIVGVNDLTILDFPDGLMEPGPTVRKAIAKQIRTLRPNIVVTSNFDLEVPWGINHIDHRVTGEATADAIRDADNRWIFTDLLDEDLEPWKADLFLVGGVTEPDTYVDVTGDALEKGIASLEAHEAYLADLSDHPAPRAMLTEMAAECAHAVEDGATDCAIGFRAWPM